MPRLVIADPGNLLFDADWRPTGLLATSAGRPSTSFYPATTELRRLTPSGEEGRPDDTDRHAAPPSDFSSMPRPDLVEQGE